MLQALGKELAAAQVHTIVLESTLQTSVPRLHKQSTVASSAVK